MRGVERRKTRTVTVGGVPIGSGHPVVVQSMLKRRPDDVEGALADTARLAEEGCRLVRVAVPDEAALGPLGEFCRLSPLPVIADIHYDHRLAIGAVEAGVAKVRLNPGNLRERGKVREVAAACRERGIPIRVGGNSGSIKRRDGTDGRSTAEALVDEVLAYCGMLEEFGVGDIIVSVKASDAATNTVVYREVARRSDYPLHLGLTATGPRDEGAMKSSVALGALLLEGIGDTVRVSLTADPLDEVRLTKDILRACGLLDDRPEVVSCPTCGRCEVGLAELSRMVEDVRAALAGRPGGLRVAVMGCVVNGPSEAAECDAGVAFGKGKAALFKEGRVVRVLPASEAVGALLQLLQEP